jgi:membrane-bound serine protease (ClpP class)
VMPTTRGSAAAARRIFWIVVTLLAGIAMLMTPDRADPAGPASRTAFLLKIDGAIGPATSGYLSKGLEQARDEGAELVIIAMDTPGGLDTSMREIIRDILAMPLPVVTYVHPSGARAASAGTYILYASHFAAMTPGTNLGAATPIQIGAPPAGPQPDEKAGEKQDETPQPKNAGERKAVNDAAAYLRSLAEMRGRNADWAERAVREGASLSAEAALREGVVEIIAADMQSLLRQLDGRETVIDGRKLALDTSGLSLTEIEPDWTDRLLATITNPNIALILMMIGLYGLIFEFMNPGALVPGTIGAISLLVGLYALAALPVDFVGVALLILGLALMVAEAFAPSFGILGLGGLAAFLLGATLMFDTDVPAFRVNMGVLAAVGVFSLGLILVVARVGLRSFHSTVQTGSEQMIGAVGKVLDWNDGEGHVFVHGERWNAEGPRSLAQGAKITVSAIDGLRLGVLPLEAAEGQHSGD